MERVWIIVSILLLVVAAIFLVRGNNDAALVAGALGAVAWFLNYRVNLRATIAEEPDQSPIEEDADEDEE